MNILREILQKRKKEQTKNTELKHYFLWEYLFGENVCFLLETPADIHLP